MAQKQAARIAPSVAQARALGQSFWQDELDRPQIQSGRLADLIERGISGVTTNPTIFGKALAGSDAYEADINQYAGSRDALVWELLTADVQQACDVLRPVYDSSQGTDGFVSIEVDPALAGDGPKTLAMALELWRRVDRPNVMTKIPGTAAGLEAIRQALAAGVNVNVTLIFGVGRYRQVVEAFMAGLEDRLAAGHTVDRLASVASFFVSRVDTKVDKRLEEIGGDVRALAGQAAIANCKLAYAAWQELFGSERWRRLAAAGARPQRCLWASTSTKNPNYPDTKYVEALIGPETVDTLPPATFQAFEDHGQAAATLTADLGAAQAVAEALEAAGIDLERVAEELEEEGVASFAKAWDEAGALIARKRADRDQDAISEQSFPASDPPPTA